MLRISEIKQAIENANDDECLYWVHHEGKNIHWDIRNDTLDELKVLLQGLNGNLKANTNFYSPKEARVREAKWKKEEQEYERLKRVFSKTFGYFVTVTSSLAENTYHYEIDESNMILKKSWRNAPGHYRKISKKELAEHRKKYNRTR